MNTDLVYLLQKQNGVQRGRGGTNPQVRVRSPPAGLDLMNHRFTATRVSVCRSQLEHEPAGNIDTSSGTTGTTDTTNTFTGTTPAAAAASDDETGSVLEPAADLFFTYYNCKDSAASTAATYI